MLLSGRGERFVRRVPVLKRMVTLSSLPCGVVPAPVSLQKTAAHTIIRWRGNVVAADLVAGRAMLGDVAAQPREHLVLDLALLRRSPPGLAALLSELIGAEQRRGARVTLVRCPAPLAAKLRAAGAAAVGHAVSLAAATGGQVTDEDETTELHVRSEPESLTRVTSVAATIAAAAGLAGAERDALVTAVKEAVVNAITHGSPQGIRNDVRVSFLLTARELVIDVADCGAGLPGGCVESGGLSRIRAGVDRVEFYRDTRGLLVRLTRLLQPRTTAAPPPGMDV